MLGLAVDPGITVPMAVRRALRTEVARMVRAAARTAGRADYEVALRLVDDAAIRELNRDYRGKDKPTDVLAFAQQEVPPGQTSTATADLLGDLVISVPTAKRQAKRGLHAELLFLASHGLCHLLGYDHRTDAEEATMNARMAGLRAEAVRRGRVRPA